MTDQCAQKVNLLQKNKANKNKNTLCIQRSKPSCAPTEVPKIHQDTPPNKNVTKNNSRPPTQRHSRATRLLRRQNIELPHQALTKHPDRKTGSTPRTPLNACLPPPSHHQYPKHDTRTKSTHVEAPTNPEPPPRHPTKNPSHHPPYPPKGIHDAATANILPAALLPPCHPGHPSNSATAGQPLKRLAPDTSDTAITPRPLYHRRRPRLRCRPKVLRRWGRRGRVTLGSQHGHLLSLARRHCVGLPPAPPLAPRHCTPCRPAGHPPRGDGTAHGHTRSQVLLDSLKPCFV